MSLNAKTTPIVIRMSILLILMFSLNAVSFAAPIYPKLTGQIVDRANMLTVAQETELLAQLKALETKSSDQLVIVTLPSLQGYDIAEFSIELARHWKIGQKGTDNGVLLVIAPKERKMRIEVGYGLEGIITDIMAHKIINQRIKPAFKKGQMFAGIKAGTTDIIALLLGNADEVAQRLKKKSRDSEDNFISKFIMLIWFSFFALPVFSSFFGNGARGRRRGGILIVPAAQSSNSNWTNSGHSGGWSGGGFGGGGGGGFSGGGGSFGGGGSSGSW